MGYSTPAYGPALAGASYLLGASTTVSTATTIYQIGGYLNTAGNTWRFAVYSGTSNPTTLVAYTPTFTTAIGANEISLSSPVSLAPGTYWITAVYSASTYIYYGSSSPAPVRYKSASVGSDPSAAFGTASSYTGYPPAYYMIVAD